MYQNLIFGLFTNPSILPKIRFSPQRTQRKIPLVLCNLCAFAVRFFCHLFISATVQYISRQLKKQLFLLHSIEITKKLCYIQCCFPKTENPSSPVGNAVDVSKTGICGAYCIGPSPCPGTYAMSHRVNSIVPGGRGILRKRHWCDTPVPNLRSSGEIRKDRNQGNSAILFQLRRIILW